MTYSFSITTRKGDEYRIKLLDVFFFGKVCEIKIFSLSLQRLLMFCADFGAQIFSLFAQLNSIVKDEKTGI